MIPFLRLPAAATALAAVCLLGPCLPAHAADETPTPAPTAMPEATATPEPTLSPDAIARQAAAEETIGVMHLEKASDASSARMFRSIDQITDRMGKMPNATPDQVTDAQKLRDELHGMIEKGLGWDSIKPEVVKSYAEAFTVAELKEISAFYRSPVGVKLSDSQAVLTEKFNKAVQQRTMVIVPMIQQKLRAASMRNRPVPPVPPVPPVVSGGSPAATISTQPIPYGTPGPKPTATPIVVSPVTPAPTQAILPDSTPKPVTPPAP